ncbi:MAG: hypothetical protein AAFO04_22225 [Cyanobacteria bacterium J06592_8]
MIAASTAMIEFHDPKRVDLSSCDQVVIPSRQPQFHAKLSKIAHNAHNSQMRFLYD